MKAFLLLVTWLSSSMAHAEAADCKRCDEISALELKVKEELPKEQPDTAAFDIEAAKIINSLGKLNDAQAKQIVSYLKYTLPSDPSRALIETLWPTISKNYDVIKKAASTLPAAEKATVLNPILHYQNSLTHGQDPKPNPATPKKSQ